MNEQVIALFKAEPDETQTDPYVEALSRGGKRAFLLPSLQFRFKGEADLARLLARPASFAGILFTSPRAVNAVQRAGVECSQWREKRNYSVGPATAALAEAALGLPTSGSEAGNARELLLTAAAADQQLPFLYPCGDKRTLSEEKGLRLVAIECYETAPHPRLRDRWEELVRTQQGLPGVLVYFSPSHVEFSQPITTPHYEGKQPKCVAIGPSTAEALAKLGVLSSSSAAKPTPDSLADAVDSLQ